MRFWTTDSYHLLWCDRDCCSNCYGCKSNINLPVRPRTRTGYTPVTLHNLVVNTLLLKKKNTLYQLVYIGSPREGMGENLQVISEGLRHLELVWWKRMKNTLGDMSFYKILQNKLLKSRIRSLFINPIQFVLKIR